MLKTFLTFLTPFLRPDLQQAIPATGAEGHAVRACGGAGDPVIVPLEHSDTVALEGIPGVAVEVIVAREHDAPVQRERHGGDPAHDALVRVRHELSVSADIKESATGVIRTSTKGHPVREESIKIIKIINNKIIIK